MSADGHAKTIDHLRHLAGNSALGPLVRFYLEKLASDVELSMPEEVIRVSALNVLSVVLNLPNKALVKEIFSTVFLVPHPPRPGHEDHLVALVLNETAFGLVPALHEMGFSMPKDKDVLANTKAIEIMRNGNWPHLDLLAPDIMLEKGARLLYQLLTQHHTEFRGLSKVLPKLMELPASVPGLAQSISEAISRLPPLDKGLRQWVSDTSPLRVQAMALLEARRWIDTSALIGACPDEITRGAMSRLAALVQQEVLQTSSVPGLNFRHRQKSRL